MNQDTSTLPAHFVHDMEMIHFLSLFHAYFGTLRRQMKLKWWCSMRMLPPWPLGSARRHSCVQEINRGG